MKSAGRRALRNPPSSNMRYSTRLYNVEGLNHKVHEPVTVPGWLTCKVKITEELLNQVSTSFEQEHNGVW